MKARYTTELTLKLLHQYYDEVGDNLARQLVAVLLYQLHLMGWRKIRIQRIYEAILHLLDMPKILGKELNAVEAQQFISETYGIDFEQVSIKKESLARYRKRGNSNE